MRATHYSGLMPDLRDRWQSFLHSSFFFFLKNRDLQMKTISTPPNSRNTYSLTQTDTHTHLLWLLVKLTMTSSCYFTTYLLIFSEINDFLYFIYFLDHFLHLCFSIISQTIYSFNAIRYM